MSTLDKIFNIWTLVFINIGIIAAAELSGTFFYATGLIHMLAVGFIALGLFRVFLHYYTYDPFLEKTVHAVLIAMIIFAVSHLVEGLSYMVFHIPQAVVAINVVNFYIISLFVILLGTELFLKVLYRHSKLFVIIFSSAIAIFAALIVLFLLDNKLVSLEADSPLLYIYMIALLSVMVVGIDRLLKVRSLVSVTRSFINYSLLSITLIAVSAVPNALYEVLEGAGMPIYQIAYISHFLFYAALSVMFLAFGHLANLPGLYQEAEKYKNAGKTQ